MRHQSHCRATLAAGKNLPRPLLCAALAVACALALVGIAPRAAWADEPAAADESRMVESSLTAGEASESVVAPKDIAAATDEQVVVAQLPADDASCELPVCDAEPVLDPVPAEAGKDDSAVGTDEVSATEASSDPSAPEAVSPADAAVDVRDADGTAAAPDDCVGTSDGGASPDIELLLTAQEAKAEDPALSAPPTEGWDDSHTHYYRKGKALTGIVGIKEGSATRYYLFDKNGALVKAKVTTKSGKLYISNASGLLAALSKAKLKKGFQWLTNYGGATGKQRYYLYRDKSGACYAKKGYSTDGTRHYTRPEGYVVRGAYKTGSRVYLADSKGKLAALSKNTKKGWLVSSAFGQGKQRYYLYRSTSGATKGAYFAKVGYSADGYAHYTRPEGYVVRGAYLTSTAKGSRIYLADTKTGKLAMLGAGKKSGWVTSSKWGVKGGRYYLERDTSGADKGACFVTYGFSTKSYAHYSCKQGNVKCGVWTSGSRIFVADSKGKLAQLSGGSSEGWLSSSTKRYYLYRETKGAVAGGCYAKLGFSSDGYDHVTLKDGSVATSSTVVDPLSGERYTADAQGKVVKASSVAAVIERYCSWAVDIANDARYGYSQPKRETGKQAYEAGSGKGDFDCSSLVVAALQVAGLATGQASWTGNMEQELVKHGWQAVAYDKDASSLRRGDILLEPSYHVEIYLGEGLRVGAHGDEYGGIGYGAKLGDQKQKGAVAQGSYDYEGEISVRTEVGSWFTRVLRFLG